MRIAALLACAAISVAAACAPTDPPATGLEASAPLIEWRPVDAATGQIGDVEGLVELSGAFPDSASVRRRLLSARLRGGDIEAVLEDLLWFRDRGYVFSSAAQSQIPELVGPEFAARAKELLLAEPQSIANSEVAWTVPAEAGLVESVYFEPQEDTLVVSSVSGRALWGKRGDGDWGALQPRGADNLTGFAGFADQPELWVASGNVDQSEDAEAYFSGLIGSVPGSGDPRVAAPEGVALSDLHAAQDRTIYASDPLGGGIYRLAASRRVIEPLVQPGTFRSPQGLATSADGSLLYVSDYRYGIAIIDLESGKVARLAADVPVMLDGTDALFRRGNSLIAIQNGISPMRISQFELSDDGMRVVGHRILEQAHPDWTEPLGGHLAADALYYVGNGQWDKYSAGNLGEGKTPDPTQIRRLPLDR